MNTEHLLEIQDFSLSFDNKLVIDKINFELKKGEILGIVGESGSGKSLTSLAIMGLLPKNAQTRGKILFRLDDRIIDLAQESNESIRGNEIGMIFQEPMTSLNPSMRCGQQVIENILQHKKQDLKLAKSKVLSLFEKVKLPDVERIYKAYPHELSGGQKQRVMIAMALASEPKLLIADEPTTALDVTVQRSILELLKELQQDSDMSIIFISHDLGVITEICDRVVVMYRGKIVEQGLVQQIFNHPEQSYTQGLIACRPRLDGRLKKLPIISDFTSGVEIDNSLETEEERKNRFEKIYSSEPILKIKNLFKYFETSGGFFSQHKQQIKAVKDVSFELYEGETLGLVGESGSGKTTLSRTLLLLEKPTEGNILYQGKDLTELSKSQIRSIRKDIQIIFQDPYSSLNPRQSIMQIITEPMLIHNIGKNAKHRKQIAGELLEKVGLSKESLNKYPHEFSGGQRQRIGIARALALQPKIIICDESVSALDVSVQAQVLNLLNQLKEEFNLTYIFISHDLSVVKYMSDRLIVLRYGEIQEYGDADEIYKKPKTQYTTDLIAAIPKL